MKDKLKNVDEQKLDEVSGGASNEDVIKQPIPPIKKAKSAAILKPKAKSAAIIRPKAKSAKPVSGLISAKAESNGRK